MESASHSVALDSAKQAAVQQQELEQHEAERQKATAAYTTKIKVGPVSSGVSGRWRGWLCGLHVSFEDYHISTVFKSISTHMLMYFSSL